VNWSSATGENAYGSIYGVYENKKHFGGWKSSYDLLNSIEP
jgi:hypothetical protein